MVRRRFGTLVCFKLCFGTKSKHGTKQIKNKQNSILEKKRKKNSYDIPSGIFPQLMGVWHAAGLHHRAWGIRKNRQNGSLSLFYV